MTLPETEYWSDPRWRLSFMEQRADVLLWLRLLLRRRIAWLRHRNGYEPLGELGGVVVTDAQVRALLDPPDPAAAATFYQNDEEAASWSESIARLEQRLGERSAAMIAVARPYPADSLAGICGLSRFEVSVLWLAHAPDLDPGFERLYAYAQDDAARRYATPALASALFQGSESLTETDAFRPGAPLTRLALIRLELGSQGGGTASRRIQLEARLAAYLDAVDETEPIPGLRLRVVRALPLADESAGAATKIAAVLGGTSRDGRHATVSLVGDAHEAAAMAAATCHLLGLKLHAVKMEQSAATDELVARLDRESLLQRAAYLFEAGDDGSGSSAEITTLVEALRAPVFVSSTFPLQLDRDLVSFTLPRRTTTSQRSLWQQALAGTPAAKPDSIEVLAHQFSLDPEGVLRGVEMARGAARLRNEAMTIADLWQACRQLGRRSLGGLAARIEPTLRRADIVLPVDVRQQLDAIVAQVRYRALVHEEWEFAGRLPRNRGVTAMFTGQSGTGKTMAAEILAGELDLDLYRIDLSSIVNKYIGETEKNLRRVFDAAEAGGAVLFFDEADSLFGKRTEVRDSHDRYANIEVDYLLQRMESYQGLAILATNRRTALDRAFLRRLRFVVEFPFPSAQNRLRIWQTMLPESAPMHEVDFAALARLEVAGGNIQTIAVNAAFGAAADGRVITMHHLMQAAAREYAKLDKAPTAAEFGEYYQVVTA